MTRFECPRESEVMDAIQAARWPDRLDEDLRTHVASCAICQDLAAVVAPVRDDAAESLSQVRVPEAGTVWLRAQMRARAEAARKASRPITAAQVIAFTSVAASAGAIFGASSAWFQTWLGGLWAFIRRIDLSSAMSSFTLPAPVLAAVTNHLGLAILAVISVLLAPVAVYIAGRDN